MQPALAQNKYVKKNVTVNGQNKYPDTWKG